MCKTGKVKIQSSVNNPLIIKIPEVTTEDCNGDKALRTFDPCAIAQTTELISAIQALTSNTSAISATGLIHVATGMPIFAQHTGGSEPTLFYFDPTTGVKTMTDSGYALDNQRSSSISSDGYETLKTGVVERVTIINEIIDGVLQEPMYIHYGSRKPYTPENPDRVTKKPIKVQMGQEDITVLGVPTSLADIPTLTSSTGQKFPQHAYIHIHADTGAAPTGISYSTDGATPAGAHETEVRKGQGFNLDSHEELEKFLAVAINSSTAPDTDGKIQLTVEYNNVAPDKDGV